MPRRKLVTVRIGAVAVVLAVGALGAGCGGNGGKSEEAEHASTPQRAVAEIAKVRSGLATALVTYKSGDKAAAGEQVGDTYLQHFELVEGPLDQVDHELKEGLEDGIREELRDRIKAGAPAAQVQRLVEQLGAKLDEAESVLQKQ
jgi:hypothetical protein